MEHSGLSVLQRMSRERRLLHGNMSYGVACCLSSVSRSGVATLVGNRSLSLAVWWFASTVLMPRVIRNVAQFPVPD